MENKAHFVPFIRPRKVQYRLVLNAFNTVLNTVVFKFRILLNNDLSVDY